MIDAVQIVNTTKCEKSAQRRNSHSYYRTSKYTRSIEWWHFKWPWRTPNPVFKVTAFLKSNIGKKRRTLKTVTIAH